MYKIINIPTPVFTRDGKTEYVISKMFLNIQEFGKYLDRMEIENGLKEVYIHSMNNCQDYTNSNGEFTPNKLIMALGADMLETHPVLFVRFKMFL